MVNKIKNNRQYRNLVSQHYRDEARKYGATKTSTMLDFITRNLEITHLISYLKDGDKCLEIGCGNGAASIEISQRKKIDLTCVDFSQELLAIAKKQPTKGVKGKVEFKQGDVLNLAMPNKFDVAFTERCIINLLFRNDQNKALINIARALKGGGRLILLEAFQDGLQELNKARSDIGLNPIQPAFHNLLLDKKLVVDCLKENGLKLVEENNFLSSYYFGSRVLYPALAKIARKKITYNSSFTNFFSLLPPVGNYAHIKILLFHKKK